MDKELNDLRKELSDLKKLVAYQSVMINKFILLFNISDTDLKNHLEILEQPLDKSLTCLYYSQVHQRNLTMFFLPTQNRSIIDEIRDEIQLDEYYRKFELNKREDCDFYDDSQSEYDYAFDSYYE